MKEKSCVVLLLMSIDMDMDSIPHHSHQKHPHYPPPHHNHAPPPQNENQAHHIRRCCVRVLCNATVHARTCNSGTGSRNPGFEMLFSGMIDEVG